MYIGIYWGYIFILKIDFLSNVVAVRIPLVDFWKKHWCDQKFKIVGRDTWIYYGLVISARYIQGVSKKRYFLDVILVSVPEVRFYFFTCVLESEF